MCEAPSLPMISPAEWFSNQIQITCETCTGVPASVPQTLREAVPRVCAGDCRGHDNELSLTTASAAASLSFWRWREKVWRSTRSPVTTIVRR